MNVEFKDVVLYYKNLLALDNLSFAVREGEIYGLLGPNGSGKTTIFKLINGIFKPDSGVIHMNHGLTIAVARQVIPSEEMELIVRDFFEKGFTVVSNPVDISSNPCA